MEYLYFDGSAYCFMNSSNYEQEFLSEDQVGDVKALLKEKHCLQRPHVRK